MARNQKRLAALVFGVAAALAAACGGGATSDDGAMITPIASVSTVTPTQPPSINVTPGPSPPTNGAVAQLRGFSYPIAGGCLPKGGQFMPNAPRAYRNGVHEGVDFYGVDNCTAVTLGTGVLAAKAGRVVRADLLYSDLTAAELEFFTANPNAAEALDRYRGRQVWIDHGDGVVTRYAHLATIVPGVVAGLLVGQGQLIAHAGESGTPESVSNLGNEYHLHFELRLGADYLGQGLPPAAVRSLYQTLFSP